MRVFLIPEKIKYHMIQNGLTSLELSKILNIKPANFSKYTNVNCKIDYKKALQIANILKVNIDEIVQNNDKIKENIDNEIIDDLYLRNKLLNLWDKINNETDKLLLLVKISKFVESRKKND